MIVTVLKTTFPKAKPKVILYRDFSKYNVKSFGSELKKKYQTKAVRNYEPFENIFIDVLHINAQKKVMESDNVLECNETII